jgi:AcrR family transcriptional regulator
LKQETTSMPTSAQPGVNEPRQRRSRETRDRLLQATAELLEERTFEDLTIQQIAARAGCSVGAFYGRFESKDAILPRLLEAHYEEMEREVDAVFGPGAWDGASLARRVDAVVDHLLSVAQRQPGLIRTLVLRNYQRPETIPASIRAAARRVLARLHAVLGEGRPQAARRAGTVPVEVGLLMVVAAIRERVVLAGATHASTLSTSSEVLAAELKRALLAYLTLIRG